MSLFSFGFCLRKIKIIKFENRYIYISIIITGQFALIKQQFYYSLPTYQLPTFRSVVLSACVQEQETPDMALWAEAQLLPSEKFQQIQTIYGQHFPIEVRHYLAPFIEENFGNEIEIDVENPEHEQYVGALVDLLIREIQNKADNTTDDNFLTKLKLSEAAKMFRQQYSSNPMKLFNYIRSCLTYEEKLLQDTKNGENFSGSLPLSNSGAEILRKIHELTRRTQETSDELQHLQQKQEDFELIYDEYTQINAYLKQLYTHSASNPQIPTIIGAVTTRKSVLQPLLNKNCAELMRLKSALCEKLRATFQLLVPLQKQILEEELSKWQKEQLEGIIANHSINLDTIQEWCENLAELIWVNREQIKKIKTMKEHLNLGSPVDNLSALLGDITQLLSKLVTSTFIVESQPPQIMKTNNKLTATVRLLVGVKLNIHMISPQVKVTIISETQANRLVKNGKLNAGDEKSGEIVNSTSTMEYQKATRHLAASFRNMRLAKIQRGGKKGIESVMDEKFCLCFQSRFNVGGGELVFHVWALSLPAVVVVHGSQEPHAWATITWDNAFSEPGRSPFAVPEQVAWPKVAEVLSLKFQSVTKRSLTEENLRFLAEKAFRGVYNPDSNNMLSWPQFATELLPGRTFTFWEWFYAAMKLTKEHFLGPWVDGSIMGFVGKYEAEQMLSTMPTGTFLLRFSDSVKGGLTIAWISESRQVFSLEPFTAKDLMVRSLADSINDIKHIMYLYPNVPKVQAFGKYCTRAPENTRKTANGYFKCSLVKVVNGLPPVENHMNPLRDTPSVSSVNSYTSSSATTMVNTDTDYFQCLGENNMDLSLTHVNDLMEGCVL